MVSTSNSSDFKLNNIAFSAATFQLTIERIAIRGHHDQRPWTQPRSLGTFRSLLIVARRVDWYASGRMRWAVFAMVALLAPSLARADDRVMLSPGPGYRVRWSASAGHRFDAFPRVERQGWSPVDRWFQVAPGGGAVAFWSPPTGLVVMGSNGAELWRRKGDIAAFRFSARGDRLAIATAKEVEILDVARRESRRIAALAGADWLGWTNVGLVVRTRSAVELVGEDGKRRQLAKMAPRMTVVAVRDHVVFFTSAGMRELTLAQTGNPTMTKLNDRDPVLNADINSDGSRVLFATAKRVYLRTGAEVKAIAEMEGVHSLSISPDGAAQVWLADAGGAVAREGKLTPLPARTRSAHFRGDGGAGLVLTTEDGVFSWDPATGAPKLVGGISRDDGVNIAGDVVGGAAISFAYLKSGPQKETQMPTTLAP